MKSNPFYKELTSRNYAYLSPPTQERLKNLKLAFLGTGLSSQIAESCVRLGFTKFYLNDGDKVELSNLNRQAFTTDQLGTYKAEALKANLLKINPFCQVMTHTERLSSIVPPIEQLETSDIIINTVDCTPLYFEIIEYGRRNNKLVICPFNPGFGGLVILFSKQSVEASEVFDLRSPSSLNDLEITRQLFENYPDLKTLEQARQTKEGFFQNVSTYSYFPQIVVGALQTTAFVLTSIVHFLEGKPLDLAPKLVYLDCSSKHCIVKK